MNKRERDIRRMVERAGLSIKEFQSHKGHYHAVLESPSGRIMHYSFSSTPGDNRGDLNCIADLRNLRRANDKMATGVQHLRALVGVMSNCYISSWQTVHWHSELEKAQVFLKELDDV